MKQDRVAIIGAGLSGLHLARRLTSNVDVTIFEKSRGLGGRMASKRTDFGYFDHGAQYFSAKTPEFRAFLAPFLSNGIIQNWSPSRGYMDANQRLSQSKRDHDIFIPMPRMTALAKKLSLDLNILHGVEVSHIEQRANGSVSVFAHDNMHGEFDLVISTAPAKQSFDLLSIPQNDNIRMLGCFTLMLRYDAADQLPFETIKFDDDILGFMSVQSARREKGDISSKSNIVVQTNNIWAENRLDEPESIIISTIKSRFAELMTLNESRLETVMLHRWRYAATPSPLGEPFIYFPERKIAACGDWCIGSRVEAAFLSANALADHLLDQ